MTKIWAFFLLFFLAGCGITNNSQPNRILTTPTFTDEIPTISPSYTIAPTIMVTPTETIKVIPTATQEPTVILKPTIKLVDQAATEQAKGERVVDYYGLGPASRVQVSCYDKPVNPNGLNPKRPLINSSISSFTGNLTGVTYQEFRSSGWIVQNCQAWTVTLDNHPEINPFQDYLLILKGLHKDGTTVTLTFGGRVEICNDGLWRRAEQGKIGYYPGDRVYIYLQTIPNGGSETKALLMQYTKGVDMATYADYGSVALAALDLKTKINQERDVVIKSAEAKVSSMRHEP